MQRRAARSFVGPFGQIVNEGFDLLSGGIVKVRSTAIIGGIRFYESGIELMLADQKAETIAESRMTVLMAVAICCRRELPLRLGWAAVCLRLPAKLFDRAETDAISFPECSIDGAGLGDSHLGAANEGRDI